MKTFEERVYSMSAAEIIMAMVDGLTHPPLVNVDMDIFGTLRRVKQKPIFGIFPRKPKYVCFGCAATNTICKISGKIFSDIRIINSKTRAEFINAKESKFLRKFEYAINYLRLGEVRLYNRIAALYGYAEIRNYEGLFLPELKNSYTNADLIPYRHLAEAQNAPRL